MKRHVFSLIVIYYLFSTCSAQLNNYTANIWYFGNNCGVDFNTNQPTALTNGAMVQGEGCATVCDMNGDLLFYTNGQEIWNSNHEIMSNGNDLNGAISATQSAIIVPVPGTMARFIGYSDFYVFTVDAVENHLANGLCYSRVSLIQGSGLGDVVEKNVLLANPVCEKLLAIKKNNETDYWLIAHEWNSNRFLVYEITINGVNPVPIISEIGSIHQGGYSSGSVENGWTNAIGYLKASPHGNKIALTIYRENVVELFDFNRSTGAISNCVTSNNVFTDAYGLEFSPSGNFLYLSQSIYSPTGGRIVQFDLTDSPDLNSYTTIVTSDNRIGAIQLGPNGKLYASELYYNYLSVINNPDEYGDACNYVRNGIYLVGRTCRVGLPTLFYHKGFEFVNNKEIVGELKSVRIYPNPANSILNIQLDQAYESNYSVVARNNLGQVVFSDYSFTSSTQIDVTEYDAGLYFIDVINNKNGYSTTSKIVIE